MLFRNTWTSQPQQPVGIDLANPLTQGLLYCENPAFSNLLRVGAPSKVAGPRGAGVKVLSTTDYLYLNKSSGLTSAAEVTVLVLGNPVSIGNTNAIFSNGNSANATPFFFIGSTASGNPGFRIRDTANVDQTVGTGTWDVTKPSMYIGVHSNAKSRFELWIDGSLRDSVTPTSKGAISLDRTAYGNLLRATAGQGAAESNVYLAAVWSRALSEAEIKALTLNPWQLFAPTSRKIWVPASAGGSSFAVSISEAASASDSVSVIIGFTPVAAESASATDAVSGAMAASVSINEAGSASDAASQVTALSGTVSEAASAADAVSSSTAQSGSVSEASSAADSVNGTATGDYAASISEAASAVSAEAAQTNFAVSRSEPASATDLASAVSAYLAAISESAAASESQSSSNPGNFSANIAEAASALDVQVALAAFTVIQVEPANATDSVFAINSWLASVTESALALDALSAFLLDPTTESAWWAYSVLPNRLNYSVALSSLSYSVAPDVLNFSVQPEDLAFSIKD